MKMLLKISYMFIIYFDRPLIESSNWYLYEFFNLPDHIVS